jgi:sugar phosphate isomerase/epimerase
MLSMTTAFVQDTGNPKPYLRRIAEAGFSHVHWHHHCTTDFIYARCEVDQIAAWLDTFGLRLSDVHASDGIEKCWTSPVEYERQAGVELVKNRIWMAAYLGCHTVVLHLPAEPEDAEERAIFWVQVLQSLNELAPVARAHDVMLALENLPSDNSLAIEKVLTRYPPDYIGICYDTGHGNCSGSGLELLERFRHRLLALCVHDNDGTTDQHGLPFTGTVDWQALASLVAGSPYLGCLSMGGMLCQSTLTERAFLARAFEAGSRLTHMIEEARRAA